MNKQTTFSPAMKNMSFFRQHMPWKMAMNLCTRRNFDLEDTNSWSVRNMTDEAIRQSIVGDLLNLTSLGIEYISSDDLIRLISDQQLRSRVLSQLQHKDVQEKLIRVGHRFKLRVTLQNLQECMDYAGIWHTGFEPYASKAA